ncbi:flagellar associated isoform B [Chlorella sorokiniana]|uniref:Flagellar associated isoform A n=1 Tax=Chlorella sorokiniana TaxID=3076 RepID=A0A2P6U0S1_CHLSO|nr:flagellar associated isoform A [Chlorella sorokiniana]PRW59915.1 flagellar associated isoform B [Chlorella sorokiniana]|eukprot:PRW59914.1 flagellar associated isoform A [Chlorella sorokiniana]
MAEVAALPLLALPASPPLPLAPDDAAHPASPGCAAVRLPVFQRHTASSRSHALVDPESETAGEIRALMRREPAPAGGRLPQLGAGGAADYVRHGGDDLRELVARKRQIFLAHMSLDTKHSEIAKLEQRAHQREEALLAAEQALEQDSQRFEEYLKENDAKLQEALRAAEAAARARAEKAAEAKRLAASIAGLKGEMGKIEEQLQECQRLKAFLDSVTPEEWFQSQAAAREGKKTAMRAEWRAACDALAAYKAEAAAAKQRAEHDMQWARTQQQWERAERVAREAAAALREALAQQASKRRLCGDRLDGEAESLRREILQKVEAALEECLAAIGPPGSQAALAAEAVERARKKERRQAARATKLAARQAEHEARIQRVLERAAAPKFQKKGKPAMMRSVLQQQEAVANSSQQEDGEDELAAYLARIDATFAGCQ